MPRYFKVFNGSRRYVKSQGGWEDTPAVFDRRRRLIRVAFPRGTAMLRSSATSSGPALPLYSAGTSTERRQESLGSIPVPG